MTDRAMNRNEMERLGALLFGYGWKSKLADVLEVNRREVSRWIAADRVAPWAADRLRAMVAIAPPPGTSDDDDRDDACQDVIDPEITRIVTLAEGAGWNRGEVTTAIFALAISDIRHAAGNAVAIEMLEQAIEAIKHSP